MPLPSRTWSPAAPAHLATLRATAEAGMPDRCRVLRPGALVSDDAGGWNAGAPTVVAEVACSIAPGGPGAEGAQQNRVVAAADWVVTLPAVTDATTADQVEQLDAAGAVLRTFEVQAVDGPHSFEAMRRLGCREVRS